MYQKSVMHVQSCCFDNLNKLLFCRSRCRRRRRRCKETTISRNLLNTLTKFGTNSCQYCTSIIENLKIKIEQTIFVSKTIKDY